MEKLINASTLDNEELVSRYQAGEYTLLDQLTIQNMSAVKFIANKFITNAYNLSFDELVQVAWDGFYSAVQRYRSGMPNAARFSTFSFLYMKYTILNYLKIEQRRAEKELSLQLPSGKYEKDGTLEDTLEDHEAQEYFHKVEVLQLREELEKVMKQYLTLKERHTLKAFHGWDGPAWNFREIAKVLEGDPERWPVIHRLYWKALKKLARSPWGIERRKEQLRELEYNPYTSVDIWTLNRERLQV